jgi:hypothetical protein
MAWRQSTTWALRLATSAVAVQPSIGWAGGGQSGSITFAPLSATSVPTLGGAMLILLALFLTFIALRTMRTGSGRGNLSSLLVAALAAATLVSAVGGVSLLRSANAVIGGNIITQPAGQSFPVLPGSNSYTNQSGVLQQVTALTLPTGSDCNRTPSEADCTLGGQLPDSETCNVNVDDDCFFEISDYRLKTDIVQIGLADNGLPLYEFRYRGGDSVYRGVMAQDVLHHTPAAVMQRPDGYLAVDYRQLGLSMERVR